MGVDSKRGCCANKLKPECDTQKKGRQDSATIG